MKILSAILILLLLSVLWPAGMAQARDGTIQTVDPPRARQGQTVLLTISGLDMPEGAIVLDFFPQRIQLVKVLSAASDEIIAQIRIPDGAPAGLYNILVYNHLGEEAFGEGMFTVDSDLIVPIISDYDPKVIGEADNGFALVFNGESITELAISHLNIEWSKGNRILGRLDTIFSYAGPDKMLAAVSGRLPEGNIRGKLSFDSTPIYMVELTIRASGAYIVGFSPAELSAGSGREIKLIGSGFNAGFLEDLSIQLLHGDVSILPTVKRVIDLNSILLGFTEELTAGTYTLLVRQGEETLLLEDVAVSTAGLFSQDTQIGNANPVDDEPVKVIADDPELPVEDDFTEPEETTLPGRSPQNPTALAEIRLRIESVDIQPGKAPARFHLTSERLSRLSGDSLVYSLKRNAGSSELLFDGFTSSGITCIFQPVALDWQEGERLLLTVTDSTARMVEFRQNLVVQNDGTRIEPIETELPLATEQAATIRNLIEPSEWSIVGVKQDKSAGHTSVVMTLRCEAPAELDPAALSGRFVFTPSNEQYLTAFGNISSSGQLKLYQEAEQWKAELSGLFVPGKLDLTVDYAGLSVVSTSLAIEDALPQAVLIGPATLSLTQSSDKMKLAPEFIEWSLDFTPLELRSTEFLSAALQPQPSIESGNPTFVFTGGLVQARLSSGTWLADVDLSQGLKLEISSSLEFDWGQGRSLSLAVQQTPQVDAAISISIPKRPVVLGPEGFTLSIVPAGSGSERVNWTRVKLSSDNVLLNSNINSFAVSMSEGEFLGESAVNLTFTRSRDLSQTGYELLQEQLVEAGTILITLYWDEIKYTYTGSMEVIK
jgi:hypothetical protein